MEALAIFFPVLFALLVAGLFPLRIEAYIIPGGGGGEAGGAFPTGRARSRKESLVLGLSYLALSLASALPIAAAQYMLFRLASDAGLEVLFQHRATDLKPYALIPGLLLGLLLGAALLFFLARRIYGARFPELLLSSDRYRPLYKEFRFVRELGLAYAFGLSGLNFLAHDNFIRVTSGHLQYSTFFSLRVITRSISEVDRLEWYAQRIGPSGKLLDRSGIQIVFRDGSRLDTYYLIEPEHQWALVKAMSEASGRRLRTERKAFI